MSHGAKQACLLSTIKGHRLIQGRVLWAENPTWRPFNSVEYPKNTLMQLALLADANSNNVAILHGKKYVSNTNAKSGVGGWECNEIRVISKSETSNASLEAKRIMGAKQTSVFK